MAPVYVSAKMRACFNRAQSTIITPETLNYVAYFIWSVSLITCRLASCITVAAKRRACTHIGITTGSDKRHWSVKIMIYYESARWHWLLLQRYEGEPESKFPYIFPVTQTIIATWPYRQASGIYTGAENASPAQRHLENGDLAESRGQGKSCALFCDSCGQKTRNAWIFRTDYDCVWCRCDGVHPTNAEMCQTLQVIGWISGTASDPFDSDMDAMEREDRRVSLKQFELKFNLSHGSVRDIVLECIGCLKSAQQMDAGTTVSNTRISTEWPPHFPTSSFTQVKPVTLSRVVACAETWVHSYSPETKMEYVVFQNFTSPAKTFLSH